MRMAHNESALNRPAPDTPVSRSPAFPLPARKMRILPLVAATYFMVSGGPYGIEDILGGAGFLWAIVILLLLPLFWSLPTALMIGELASAIPADGGFYIWVRRALGPFWGYQEGWLSLAASGFDMAIYPAIFVSYLGKLFPSLTQDSRGYWWLLAVVVVCSLWNLRGAPAVGRDSVWLFILLLVPFVVFAVLGLMHGLIHHPAVQWGRPASNEGFSTAVLVAMWNYMGWDNASTIARDVENPQRTYPRAVIASTALVAVTYILPLAAMAFAGLSVQTFATGDWTTAAKALGGPALGVAIVAGGAISGIGMFNALVMSYTRLPMAMAEEGMLPRFVGWRTRRGVPWVSVVFCGIAWALALKLPFERLISIDLILYGSSLLLEFVALAALRLREPKLERPFRAGSFPVACLLGVGPAGLIAYALYVSRSEKLLESGSIFGGPFGHWLGSVPALVFAVCVGLLGPLLYWITAACSRRNRTTFLAENSSVPEEF